MKPAVVAAVVAAGVTFFLGRAGGVDRRMLRVWPVRPKRGIISGYGVSRDDGARIHAGADLGALPGDEIVAWADGVVLHNVSGFGIYGKKGPRPDYVPLQAVAIEHGNVQMIYAEIRVDVKPGQRVRAGQRIGRADRNGDGNSMLHLEAWKEAPKGFTPWSPDNRPAGLLNVNDYLAGL